MSQLTDNLYTIDAIKSGIRSAIEEKGVDMTGLSFPDYPGAISQIPTGGEITQKDVTEGLSNLIDLSCSASFVASYAFYFNYSLQTVNLPNCISVGMSAFYFCQELTSVNLPVCETLNTGAFSGAALLNNIYLPLCSDFGAGTLRNTSLERVDLPKCVTLRTSTFLGDGDLVSVNLPICETIQNDAFKNCTSLQSIVLPKVTNIYNFAFSGCTQLNTITIKTSTVCTLSGTPAFAGTPISAGTGSIYVPASLVDSYKSAYGWQFYSSQIFPIQESSLAFDSSTGLLYGTASSIYWEFESSLGISLTDILAVSLSQCTSVGAAAFRGCTNLSTVTLDSCDYIGDGAFTSTGLQTLQLGGSNVCQVDSWGPNINSNTFVSLYVPSSLVTSYETASYWSNFSTKIVPIQ
jgi:hypothetical protein